MQQLSLFLVVSHPLLDIIVLVLEAGLQKHDLHEVVDEHVAPQVLPHGLAELLLHFFEALVERLELLLTPLERFRLVSLERLFQLVCIDAKLIRKPQARQSLTYQRWPAHRPPGSLRPFLLLYVKLNLCALI